jgi:hypothetical protein
MSTRLDPHLLDTIELDLETARGQFATGQISPAIDEGTKVLAAAIAQAGAEIALAIALASDRKGD